MNESEKTFGKNEQKDTDNAESNATFLDAIEDSSDWRFMLHMDESPTVVYHICKLTKQYFGVFVTSKQILLTSKQETK